MPHKRAKRSVREIQKKERGFDLAPKALQGTDDAPRGALRILNAEGVRAEWKEKKRKREEEGDKTENGEGKGKRRKVEQEKTDLKLREGESLGDFNRRVEQAMTPRLRASKASKAKVSAIADTTSLPAVPNAATKNRKIAFDTLPKTTRLNDVAQAPPSFTKLPRNAGRTTSKKTDSVVSMATKVALEEEREKVVERYRQLKEGRLKQREAAQIDVT